MRPLWRKHDHAWQVYVPLPFPLRWVNAYVLKDDEGATVIDPGLHTEAAEQCWMQALKEIGFSIGDVHSVVLTHHHPDHYGLAGWFQERSGCKVFMSAAALGEAERLWGEGEEMSERIHAQFMCHGMDQQTGEQMMTHLKSFVPLVSPQPNPGEVAVVSGGETFVMAGGEYETIHSPGHAYGHLCFYDAERRVLFCGDHVLPSISPNVSLLPGGDPNPLQSYLDSLHAIAEYDVIRAYPGHRDPFSHFKERVEELLHHHEERLAVMLDLADSRISAYALCRRLFGDRLSVHQLRFAMAETLAHLRLLEVRGRLLRETDDDGKVYFVRL